MAKKKAAAPSVASTVVQDALAELELKVEAASDWTALDQFSEWGLLVDLLGPTDAGVMIRSSDRGRARSIGIFVGGQSQWTTCRDDRELVAMLSAIVVTLQNISDRALSQKDVRAIVMPRTR